MKNENATTLEARDTLDNGVRLRLYENTVRDSTPTM
tara:strand:- start:2121 stop:2228 length:108 start_codon:yes stop_codon:yes gene_type:complete